MRPDLRAMAEETHARLKGAMPALANVDHCSSPEDAVTRAENTPAVYTYWAPIAGRKAHSGGRTLIKELTLCLVFVGESVVRSGESLLLAQELAHEAQPHLVGWAPAGAMCGLKYADEVLAGYTNTRAGWQLQLRTSAQDDLN